MSYDPSIVGRYGNLAEKWAAERYPLSLDYPVVDGLKFDATARDGRPFDIKSCMVNGVRPTFKFWDDQHKILGESGGGYVLVWYEARETEISVKESRSLSAESIKITNWTNPGETHYRSHAKEAQIPADQLRP
ncbi:ORF9 [Halorubrum pleomorphic virus 11]|uniref:ORF9 n=2 Tax=Betapleolipovirus TaxID=1911605 RepID=A0A410N6P6_9VIRU|nr:ORF9 [Halorubrum pleomorphic virus 12]YP_009819971.1 ORF9 [Halorubrum pleomorphic virus 11]QAS68812.1 ORF9 [Halorubrum pleomorphic virus 12]QAS68909.1 ORF9 [Halorubrum pleomorphic virus 11]